jgi:hypothetical protein
MIFAAVLALMLAMLAAINWRQWRADHSPQALPPAKAAPHDTLRARFALCRHKRVSCVVDGDTIWFQGEKIRVADINAPEVSEPQCDFEQELGEKASDRLVLLLNAGPFSLTPPADRDADVYGRKLRVISRGGSLWGRCWSARGWPSHGQGIAGIGAINIHLFAPEQSHCAAGLNSMKKTARDAVS